MMMPNTIASGWPPVWINQATLSTIDSLPSRDPENSGFGTTQVTVWEEDNGNDWDIYMKYNLADGALGMWVFPPFHPATTGLIEINPAVTVTNTNPFNGFTEIHVVYQRENQGIPGSWDICHTWTNNFGAAWTAPVILDMAVNDDAIDPAIVYTEDPSNPRGMLVQFVWSEFNPAPASLLYEIMYDAYYYDPTLPPPGRGYVGAIPIRGAAIPPPPPIPAGDCFFPEIASIDEIFTPGIYDYYFAVVWQEQTAAGQWNIWYVAGTTTIVPGPPAAIPNMATMGQLNANPAGEDCYDPDIAASQDYAPNEAYYFHVNWVHYIPAGPGGVPPQSWQIDSCYSAGWFPTPAPPFAMAPIAHGPMNSVLDRPTIALKLINILFPIFETWMAWEDSANPVATIPDIWYRVGWCNFGLAPPFGFMMPAARVGYLPGVGGQSIEGNPEFWNRNELTRMFPPLTHLVFDQDLGGGTKEVVYIDP
jgi:hypothetical protein